MEDFSDWFMVPPVTSFDPTNNSNIEKEEICIQVDDGKNSCRCNESSENISKRGHLKIEKTSRKQNILRSTAEVSTNVNLPDISITHLSGTSDQRKADKNTGKGPRLLRVRNVKPENNPPNPFQEKMIVFLLCCCFAVLHMFANLREPAANMTSLDPLTRALQRENILLKKQISHNQNKENRKFISLSNLISVNIEEKENITSRYLQQLELEALYLKEINSLKEEVSSLKAKCEKSQNHLMKGSSILEGTNENYELPGSNDGENNMKRKSNNSDAVVSPIFICFLTYHICVLVIWGYKLGSMYLNLKSNS